MAPPSPPPPPPPPTPGSPAPPFVTGSTNPGYAAPMAGGSPPTAGPPTGATVPDHNDQLMAAIRNGINLKPTKTNDRSTAGFIKRANGPLNGTPEPEEPPSPDKTCSIDEMKDALQAELRNTLKRKIKQQYPGEDTDAQKNDEIERSIEHTRNEVQLKLNSRAPTPAPDAGPKVDNPLKMLVDMVDKERGVGVAATTGPALLKQTNPVVAQNTNPSNGASVNSAPPLKSPPLANGNVTLKKVSVGQSPLETGSSAKVNVSTTPWKSASPSSPIVTAKTNTTVNATSLVPNGNKNPTGIVASNGPALKSPVAINPTATAPSPSSPALGTVTASKMNTSQTVKASTPPPATLSRALEKVPNGTLPRGIVPNTNGTAPKNVTSTSVAPKTPLFAGMGNSGPVSKGGTYYNTLPRAYGASPRLMASSVVAATKAAPAPAAPPVFNSSIKVTIGSFEDSNRPPVNGGRPIVRNGAPSKIEPLTIDTTSVNGSGGSSTNGTSSPSTPKELLSPQVRSGAASIRPSQIRTLTKAGSVVSHTDIVDTSKQIVKLPVSLIEPVPVLTAAAAVSPAPMSPRVAPVTPVQAKERTPLFEKASHAKEPPKSPMNRWADSSSVSGGTARKLLLSHGRPNFTIKRSNSRQGFDVDAPDSRNDTVKPVFRILTDLEKMETEQDQHQQRQEQAAQRRPSVPFANGGQQPPQQYVSFAKDLSNAPNNHPDVAVVTKTVDKPSIPDDPFLATLKDIKIDIGEMKVVNAKET